MTYPHCDSQVLHAPGECRYCDCHPDWQAKRIEDKINFTGHYRDGFELCPSELARPLGIINRWGGNRAETRTDEQIKADWDVYWAEVTTEFGRS